MSLGTELHETKKPALRAVLIAVQTPHTSESEVAASLAELERLARGLGMREVARFVQRRANSYSATVVGEGKLREIAAVTGGSGEIVRGPPKVRAKIERARPEVEQNADVVIFDGELDPGQERNLENALGVMVIDRAGIILRVFEERARTREARLEVEMARLRYETPRLRDDKARDDRVGGGGRGARGHTNVELAKEQNRERMAELERELEEVEKEREAQRARRSDARRASLVGYTNAGKSSLMRALTGSDVFVEDALFATLGTTVRRLSPAVTPPVLVSDTVGFIKNLPHELVASFRSTLDEAREAALLLLVVDASDPEWRSELAVTRETLASIGAGDVPTRVLLNKIDRVDESTRAALARELPDAIQLSAHDPSDVTALHEQVVRFFDESLDSEVFVVPFTRGKLAGEIRASARVLSESHTEEGTLLYVRAEPAAIDRWRAELGPRPIETASGAVELARACGLELDGAELDDGGLDFLVVHAKDASGRAWVLKLPRRADVFPPTRVEAKALRALAPRLSVAVPELAVHARSLLAYPRLEGTPAVLLGAGGPRWTIDRESPPDAFVDSTARFFAELQATPLELAASAGVATRTIEETRAGLRKSIAATRTALGASDAIVERWHRWIDDDSSWPDFVALVHGDLHPGHMLLGDDGALRAVLDWSEIRVTDPSIDFAMFYGAFGGAAFERLVAAFEAKGGRTWPALSRHAPERWAAFAPLLAEWGLDHDDDAVIAHARALLATVE
jgi:GTP-binding protein HflX